MLSRLLTAALALLLAASVAVTFDGVAVAASPGAPASAPAARAATSSPGQVSFAGDTVVRSSGRASVKKWGVRTLWYYKTLPAKWDWSLSTAVAKWNASGARIRLARTTVPRKAQLRIGYARTGAAAAKSTVGRVRNAYVHLSSRYAAVDGVNARNRVTVMNVLAHELGHVYGFQHTAGTCTLMAASVNITGCNILPAAQPGFYKCRTLDYALVQRFVRAYGGRARYPSARWCLIDPLPPALSGVTFTGGLPKSAPVGIRWLRPRTAPAGSRILIRRWVAGSCFTLPASADTFALPLSATSWEDSEVPHEEAACFRVQLVNRYGAGRPAQTTRLARFAVPPAAPVIGSATYVPADHVFRAPVDYPADTHLEYAVDADPTVCPDADAARTWVSEDVERLGVGIGEFVSTKAPACVSFFSVHDTTYKVSAPTSITVDAPVPTETVTVSPLTLRSSSYPWWAATVTGAATDHKVAYASLHGPCDEVDPASAFWHLDFLAGGTPPDEYYFPSRGAGTNCALVTSVDWLVWNPRGGQFARHGPIVMREFVDEGPLVPELGEPTWNAESGRFTLPVDNDMNVEAVYDPDHPTSCVAPGAASAEEIRLYVFVSQTVSLSPPTPDTCVTFYRRASDGDIRLSDGVEVRLVVPQG